MKIDMHLHSSCSDGAFSVGKIFKEAKQRNISFISITDHDSIGCQETAVIMARKVGIRYVTGVELNVSFSHSKYREGKPLSLDFLGYQFDPKSSELNDKLQNLAIYRKERAEKILANLNVEFEKEGIAKLTNANFEEIQISVDGTLGRPHIADYLVKKGIVKDRQEAFDRYLVKCDIPKFPLSLGEASRLIRGAGGRLVIAHPNDPHGTSLVTITKSLPEQTAIIEDSMLPFIDGVECWHSRNDDETTKHYIEFAEKHKLIMTGGSDCHQKPLIMGTIEIPQFVVDQFSF